MAYEKFVCPHCRTKQAARSECDTSISGKQGYLLFVCPSCQKPIVYLIQGPKFSHEYRSVHHVKCADEPIADCEWTVVEAWPKPEFRTGDSPAGVPEPIRALFEQSQSVAVKGAHDLAMLGFQRVLKMAQAAVSPEFRGKPRAWILGLIDGGKLTADLKSWVNRVKLGDVEGVSTFELEECATFVQVVLEQLFAVRSRMTVFRRGGAEQVREPLRE